MSWYIQEQEPVYVDNNATTQIDDRVQQKVVDAVKNLWANPSSAYEIGWFWNFPTSKIVISFTCPHKMRRSYYLNFRSLVYKTQKVQKFQISFKYLTNFASFKLQWFVCGDKYNYFSAEIQRRYRWGSKERGWNVARPERWRYFYIGGNWGLQIRLLVLDFPKIQANALIIHVAMKNVPRGVLPHIVTTSLEHPSIIEPLKYELEQNNIGMFQRISKFLLTGSLNLLFF